MQVDPGTPWRSHVAPDLFVKTSFTSVWSLPMSVTPPMVAARSPATQRLTAAFPAAGSMTGLSAVAGADVVGAAGDGAAAGVGDEGTIVAASGLLTGTGSR